MAKFKFKLQSVLRFREQVENNIKNEFGIAVQKLEREKAELRRLNFARDRHIFEFNQKSEKAKVRDLIEYNNYISFLNSKINHQKDVVNCALNNVDKIRDKLTIAVKKRKILEKLKEKKLEEFLYDLSKEEYGLTDEITSYKQSINIAGETNKNAKE